MVEDRRGDGLGEHRLGQQVVVGGLRVLEGQRVVDAGLGGEPHRVAAGVGVRGREVRAAAQRVGDTDRVVVGAEQRALVAVDGLCRSTIVVTIGIRWPAASVGQSMVVVTDAAR
ncbi:hypothetical protein ABT115_15960 [Streptomyces sp. NPDC001832]|uniref:hypothetical protein n=1 Tax=Streptomyces sp. NPDC001832 TaxID=3154527 RepID=UPI00331D4B2D